MARQRAIKYKFRPKGTKKIAPDLKDKKFGKWTVIRRAENRFSRSYWVCKCDCGLEKEIASQTLINGTSKCCTKCSSKDHFITHGFCRNRKKIPEYHIWNSIKNRCRNPNTKAYMRYGGRGITICDEWYNSFEKFFQYVGAKPFPTYSLDRIDNEKGYEPGNVRWTSKIIQAGNTRKQPLIEGKRICITQLAKKINKCRFWVSEKLREGIDIELLANLPGPEYKEYRHTTQPKT